MKEKMYFYPKRTDDLKKECLPFINKEVTVLSWHDTHNWLVGLVEEFMLDIPWHELHYSKPDYDHNSF